MHAFVAASVVDKPALAPRAAIGPAMQAIAADILAQARAAITDPRRSSRDAVHDFRRTMKQWRSLMRLLAPFIVDARRWRDEARDHAHALALARDSQSALNALDDLAGTGAALSKRSLAAVRGRIEALRGSEEQAAFTAELHAGIMRWLDAAAAAVELWPLDPYDFSMIAARLTAGYRNARQRLPADWSLASAEDLHKLRRLVVDLRYQMELIEPLWPRFGRMWVKEAERLRDRLGRCQDLAVLEGLTAPHRPLARWRAPLTRLCAARRAKLAHRAARIAHRLFAEQPKALRHQLQTLWENGR